jgi:hypothetical protein
MTIKARLHWFWRGAIATILGMVLKLVLDLVAYLSGGDNAVVVPVLRTIEPLLGGPSLASVILSRTIVYTTPTVVASLVVYALLTRAFGPPVLDGELHCRKCDYILRGLSEPRCPECGEVI